MREFEANNSQDAYQLFSQEALRAEYVRRAIVGHDNDVESSEPTEALPASLGGVVPLSPQVSQDIKETVIEYEAAMKTLLGHYAAAMAFESQNGPAGQLQSTTTTSGWQPSYR